MITIKESKNKNKTFKTRFKKKSCSLLTKGSFIDDAKSLQNMNEYYQFVDSLVVNRIKHHIKMLGMLLNFVLCQVRKNL